MANSQFMGYDVKNRATLVTKFWKKEEKIAI